ncbi:hypothetical protein PpBr36_07072 [Pyricularia pennisetigena]|uniref:hypothetical protein n=1 Tax=Pyricularia pennisetigena TaxID=1578925 RepID=UPI00114D91A8|nr:hypothetical protein PpBr36_07072 [Pyricularia pennisetigena]TLS25229.1 hypothetical protein PpBr36_07072 [Pyricularia pennisetigena]
MSATASQPPVVPPRPSRSQDKDQIPKIPPRPIKSRVERSMSPSRDRFAPSPLNDRLGAKSPLSPRFGNLGANNGGYSVSPDPVDRSSSVDLPSLGEEGKEYAAMADELESGKERSVSPTQTRNVAEDLKLHAPKPSHPAVSAKQRVAAVTRTDSDRAASFGIGKPSNDEPASSNRSLKKKASTISQLSARSDSHADDEHGIPEIGKQVPMYPNAGDVQAPSPAPGSMLGADGQRPKQHHRRASSRGDAPPGSYGLHGHGIKSQDKLDMAYYEKHPELKHRERQPHHHDRPNDFSMSREELNKIVRDTANNRATGHDFSAPPEQAGWEAIEESASRIASPKPVASGSNSPVLTRGPQLGPSPEAGKSNENVIHVHDPRKKSGQFDAKSPGLYNESDEDGRYSAPILADDEVSKDFPSFDLHPAVDPGPERTGSAFEMEPSSRPKSRPASIYRESSHDIRSTPLEDVKEYEPLFPEEEKSEKQPPKPESPTTTRKAEERKHKFPSRDIWEDAPDSVHGTAEVSTPDVQEQQDDYEDDGRIPRAIPPRDSDTPAQAFARRQEELAEAESRNNPDAFLYRTQKPSWVQGQSHLAKEFTSRSSSAQSAHSTHHFPSRDTWEDTPDSLLLETEVSREQDEVEDDEEQQSATEPKQAPEMPQRPVRKFTDPSEKPAIPERPKPKHTSSDDGSVSKPIVPERPKPQVPARPQRQSSGSSNKEGEPAAPVAKTKPPVPARPVGGKIAALQAGFMADLNKRLQLGPQAQKHEEPAKEEEPPVEQEKAPLVDARKGRARGPQRRAPARSPVPPAATSAAPEKEAVSFSFSTPMSFFSIDPEEGVVTVGGKDADRESSAAGQALAAQTDMPDQEPEPEKAETSKPPAMAQPVAEEHDSAENDVKPESLVTNMAGETLVEVDVEKNGKKVDPVNVEEGQLGN